jgi:hypothetical protein
MIYLLSSMNMIELLLYPEDRSMGKSRRSAGAGIPMLQRVIMKERHR